MAGKIYDIVNKLNKEKPVIKLAEDKEFIVNNSMKGAIAIKGVSENDNIDEFEGFRQIIAIGLGQEALEYIESQDYSVKEWAEIANALMAAISEEELEDLEEKINSKKE